MNRMLESIAKQELGIPTLETQNSDSLDLHDCAVWRIRDALDRAFSLGFFMGLFGVTTGVKDGTA